MTQFRKALTILLILASLPVWFVAGGEQAIVILALAYFTANWDNFWRE